jgi:3-hydroxyisobutyrate dehydrogenase
VDVIVTMLPTGREVRSVLLEENGGALAESLKPGALVIDMSSAAPTATRELGPLLATKSIHLIDAPVSGGVKGAEAGTLTIMIGCDDDALAARAEPVLQAMGQRLFRTGGLGSGHAMKCLNNMMAGAGFLIAVEAVMIGRKFGLDPGVMTEIINKSTGRSFASEVLLAQEIISRRFGSGFTLGLLTKDVKIAADLAEDIQVNAPFARAARDLLVRAREVVGAEADHTAGLSYWEALNGFRLSGDE